MPRLIIERECEECGRYHHDSLLKPGGHPESSIAYCMTGSKRIIVDPADLPSNIIEAAAEELQRLWEEDAAAHDEDYEPDPPYEWDALYETQRDWWRTQAEAALKAGLAQLAEP